MIRIVHVVESFAGGVFEFLRDLINATSDLEHTIVYGLRPDTPSDFKSMFYNKVNFVKWENANREISLLRDSKATIELINILENLKPFDVLHLHSSKAGFIGRVVAKLMRVSGKVIYTTHGISFLRKDINYLNRNLYIYLEKFASFLGGNIISCSPSENSEIIKTGIKSSCITNGVRCDSKDSGSEMIKQEENIVIGTVGRISVQKNPKMFNEIASLCKNQFKNLYFLWIGDGEDRHYLNNSIVNVTGWLKRDDVKRYIKKIDIYLSTSLWEGLPLSVLEAMCLKKPLILSNCTGNKDLVINGYNGFLYDGVHQAIEYISFFLSNRDEIERMGRNSQKLVREKFNINYTIEEYKKLYFTIFKNSTNL